MSDQSGLSSSVPERAGPGVEHVIVLVLENRSFDHLLGYLDHPDPTFDGLRGPGPFVNPGWEHGPAVAASDDGKTVLPIDPDHSHDAVLEQLGMRDPAIRQPDNQGFVRSYERKGRGNGPNSHAGPVGKAVDLYHRLRPGTRIRGRGPLIMRCHAPQSVPVLATLAKEFAVCTRWFASVPGETWPNRNFIHAATSAGETDIEPGFYYDRTIFELLEDAGKSWHIYHDDTPQVWVFANLWVPPARHAKWFAVTAFAEHVASGQLPTYSFIEPNQRPPFHLMDDGASTGADVSNSQHPCNNLVSNAAYDTFPTESAGDFTRAEGLIASVYEALRAKPDLFERSILLITHDEHGGTYDHRPPPTDVPAPIAHPRTLNRFIRWWYRPVSRPFDFHMLGVRVPAIVISPLVERGSISTEARDHASVPSTLRALFAPRAAPLTARDAWAPPFHTLLTREQPRQADLPDLSAHLPPTPRATAPEPPRGRVPEHYRPFTRLASHVGKKLRETGVPRSQAPLIATRSKKAALVSQAFKARAEEARASS